MNGSAYQTDGVTVDSASGVWVTQNDGTKLLDGCAGTFNVGLGYGHPRVTQAIKAVIDRGFLHGSGSLATDVIREAENQLVSIAPSNLNRCHLKGCTGGSSAVEQAIRHSWATTGRYGLISFEGGHHGQTIATSLVSGMDFRKKRLTGVRIPVEYIPAPDCYRCPYKKSPKTCHLECADAVVDVINQHKSDPSTAISAFIAEPILGAGGGIVPHKDFWPKVSERLGRLGVLLILDEVQTFGRLGTFFAADSLGANPSIITLAKSISGIGVPGTGAILLPDSLCVLESGERSLTWGGSTLVASAIEATIIEMKSPGFFTHVQSVGAHLQEKLSAIAQEFEFIGCIRGSCLMTGLEIVRTKESKEPDTKLATMIIEECLHEGLLLRQSLYGNGSFIKIRPALTITTEEVNEMIERLKRALQRAITREVK